MTTYSGNTQRVRLTRLQQLTLNTWRWAHTKLGRVLDPAAVLEHVALHAVVASLRDVDTPTGLFDRHAHAYPEFSLITSLLASDCHSNLRYELLDSAFLMRWNELTTASGEPEELPPLRKVTSGNRSMRARPS